MTYTVHRDTQVRECWANGRREARGGGQKERKSKVADELGTFVLGAR